ncbi:integrase/recombinase XerD [Pseudacidovorax intermedius]|uniref:Integrase/recombinase XerD n=1 Tax=Pseudacidovorax intermedius TaxID=433924 RepID=A0A370FFK7_9BURK|nr:tyrosine-type recombinase/integrase [Pseudacidovorax intermedius]RDI25206.1 integrase/recombinase XerD [Pseudacidovorax intermedius]
MNGNWTQTTAIDAWMEYIQANKGRSPRTAEAYGMALRKLSEFLGRDVLDATAEELEAFTGLWLHKRGVVALSRKPYISAVKGFFAWAAWRGIIDGNPAGELVHPKTGLVLPETISLANAERLACAPDLATFTGIRDSAILHVLLGCGLRVSGLVGLNEGDLLEIEVDGRRRLAVRTFEKGSRERRVPMPKEAEAIVRVYLGHEELLEIDRDVVDRRGHADKVLFVSTRNSTVSEDRYRGEERRLSRQSVHDIIQKHGKAVGIPERELHPHALRHIYGTELTEDEIPTLGVQDLMGHSDPKSTAVYTALSMRKKTRWVDKASPLAKVRTPVSELLKRLPDQG